MTAENNKYYMLWFAPTTYGKKVLSLEDRCKPAIVYYAEKYGKYPGEIQIRKDEVLGNEDNVMGVSVKVVESGVTPKHILIGD